MALLLCSCHKATYLTPDTNHVTIAKQGGEVRVMLGCDGNFDIDGVPDWLKVEKEESEDEVVLVFIAGENTTGSKREAMVNLIGGDDVSTEITVIQVDKCTYIKASKTEVTIPKEGGDVTLDIDTDGGDFKVEAPEGVTADYSNGKLKVSAPANEGGTINGTVTLSCDNVTTEVKVTVEGNICPTCNGTGKVRCTKCGGRGFSSSNTAHSGEDHGCKSCGGSGYRYTSDGWWDGSFVPSTENHGFHKGSGQMNCPDCGGTGH